MEAVAIFLYLNLINMDKGFCLSDHGITHHHIKITEKLLPNQIKTCKKVLGMCECQNLESD